MPTKVIVKLVNKITGDTIILKKKFKKKKFPKTNWVHFINIDVKN